MLLLICVGILFAYPICCQNVTRPDHTLLHGLDLLGWGIDMRIGKPFEALQQRYYDFTFKDKQTYFYPLNPNLTFSVPDDIYVRTVSELFESTEYYNDTAQYINQLNLKVGLNIKGQPKGGGNANATGSDFSSWAGNLDVDFTRKVMEDQRHIIISNYMDTALYQVFLGPTLEVRKEIEKAISDTLTISLEEKTGIAFAEFFSRYGTHYVVSAMVGGSMEQRSLIDKSVSNSSDQLAIAASVQLKNMLGLDDLSVNLTLDFQELQSKFEINSNNYVKVSGGDSDLTNFFGLKGDVVDASDLFSKWHRSLITNPVAMRVRLRNVCWLFDDSRADCAQILAKYLRGDSTLQV